MAEGKSKKDASVEHPNSNAPPQEVIVHLPLSELNPYPDNPYAVRDDPAMQATADSIKSYGVLTPAIVRPAVDGGYEIISGHRRKYGCELARLDTMPCIIRNLGDDEAIIQLVDSNAQREDVLPSERAKAYKMRLEAIKRRAGRPQRDSKENGAQVGHNFDGKKSVQIVADQAGESKSQVQRYIRLTELTPPLLQMVDEKKIALTPAVELSYLKPEEQALMVDTIESEQATPSLSQAQRMRRMSEAGTLNEETMLSIMMEQKKPEKNDITLSGEKLRKYFPRSYTPKRIEETIFKLLDAWQRKRQRDQSR